MKPKQARRVCGESITFQGNLDPCALYASKVSKQEQANSYSGLLDHHHHNHLKQQQQQTKLNSIFFSPKGRVGQANQRHVAKVRLQKLYCQSGPWNLSGR